MQRGLRVITLQGAIHENEWLDVTIIISYFDGSNNIFADFTHDMVYRTSSILFSLRIFSFQSFALSDAYSLPTCDRSLRVQMLNLSTKSLLRS